MKLFQTYLSPFPTRVRMVLYAKGIECEIIEPSGFHGDGEAKGSYLNVNPIGRVPALVLDDGRVLPESEVICEYLEEAFPDNPVLPSDPWERSQVRLLSRISDIYIVMAMLPLFIMVAKPPASWDQTKVSIQIAEIDDALGFLEEYIGSEGFAVGHSLTTADGTLVPILLLVESWLPIFRGPDLLARHPKTASYWRDIQKNDICARLIKETQDALKQQM